MSRIIGVIGWSMAVLTGCGTGLPPEEPPRPPAPREEARCGASGIPFDFKIQKTSDTQQNNAQTLLYWAPDAGIDPIRNDGSVKLRFDVAPNNLPDDVTSAVIRIAPEPRTALPAGYYDTPFRISPVGTNFTGFVGNTNTPLRLSIRYDPVGCDISSAIEPELVLARLTETVWEEVCGETANIGTGIREVACDQGNLSFGVFAVIRKGAGVVDPDPPFFPSTGIGAARSLAVTRSCTACGTVDFEWGAASDGEGSGVKQYFLYARSVDSNAETRFIVPATSADVQTYTVRNEGLFQVNDPHIYSVTAVDDAGNESERFGSVPYPS